MKKMSEDRIEFEDDAPLELTSDSELEQVSRDEVSSPSKKLDEIFEKDNRSKAARDAKVKEPKPALKLRNKNRKMKENHEPKEYIAVECQLCQREYTHAKKDDNGAYLPFALCQHVIFKGVFLE
jgi:hypothetical protein